MKILFLSISFNESQENLYTDLVDCFLENGHEVVVVSSNTSSTIKHSNYQLIGFKKEFLGSRNFLKKGLTTITIGYDFKKVIKKYLSHKKFDIVLYATPPITISPAVKYCKKKFGVVSFLMLKDIFPQGAIDLNVMKKNGIIDRYFRRKEQELYNISDFIGCMSERNKEYVLKHNKVSKEKLLTFCNSIKIDKQLFVDSDIYKNLDITTFMFGGNLGIPQNISGLLSVISALNDYRLAKFIIVGKGAEDYKIKSFINKYNPENLEYYEFIPREKYEEMLKKCNVGLISLDPRFTIPNIPSKFQTYLKLGKAVFAITDLNTDLKDMILENDCGWWCDASDQDEIIETIKYICENKHEQIIKGQNGYIYLKKEFNVESNVKIIEKIMEDK